MLATRIIPTVLCRGTELVKGKQFNSWRSCGNALQAARIYAARGVDELVFLDIGATPSGSNPNLDMVRRLVEGNFTPITVGGGIKTIEDVQNLLNAGADKVSVNSVMFDDGEFLIKCSQRYGSQAIIASIDCLNNVVYSGKICRGWIAKGWAKYCENAGAGEILLTSIEREGMMEGYDLDLIHEVSSAVSIPVIAHGGCGTYEHMYEAIQAGASAVAAGSMFLFTDLTPKGAAEYLYKRSVEVRLT